MAAIATELATLRALTFRISSTNTAQLPQHVPAIASSLANCKTLLSSSQGSGSKAASNSEASVVVHKFRTLLSTLLQDRTIQGRWAAIVLIKASIEVGGWETLQKCLPWVRGLLGILTKPDPHSTKKLCIITLTRIFMLTREFPTLVREITTPSLPTFVQSCLQIANAKAPAGLLQIILESFGELLPRHPTIFRSYLKQLQPLLARLIAPTPSSKLASEQTPGAKLEATSGVISAAQRLYAQLPCCAPKGASSEEWQKSLKNTISVVHRVADKVFRAVHEEWQLSTRDSASVTGQTLDDEVQDLEPLDLALPPWSGLFAGNERLIHLVRLIQQFLDSSTANAVNLNVAALIDLTSRLLSLTVPSAGSKSFQTSIRFNNQVSKDERENLFSILPAIHVCTIDLLLSLANRSQASTLSLDSILLDQLSWVFGAESNLVQVRTGCYAAVTAILQRSGAALMKSSVDTLVPLMRSCCNDLLPAENMNSGSKETAPAKTNGAAKPQVTANADAFLSTSKAFADPTSGLIGLKEAAYNLLPVLFANLKAQYLSDSLRARLDRTAILIQHKDAMINSVLNPPPSKKFGKPAAGILPLLARSFPTDRDVEAMLRPRMPVIRTNNDNTGSEDVEEDGEENEDEDEPEEELAEDAIQQDLEQATSPEKPEEESTTFAGHELDTILEAAGRATASGADTSMPDATPAENKPSIAAPALDVSRYEPVASKDKPKRPPPTDAPRSPSKRMKGDEGPEKKHIPPSVPMPTRATRSSARTSDVPATSDFTATSTASAIPELPTPGDGGVGEDSDDDEDDVIPLVLGQDTDDEDDE